ncbi:fatty acid desaturase [Saccharopolyspora sp. NPDC050642]|uniref:fatty acid desaturase n=1 Tax=Saccharopolyspora sp. NPDC050642 TaxID=3157099 RepID=UPI003406C428
MRWAVLDEVMPGDVLVVEARGSHTTGCFGDMLVRYFKGRGGAGMVVDGRIRDGGAYMGCVFAPNHKGMPTLSAGDRLDYLRKQVLTSRNVRGSRFVDFLLGGLNYQIEHHLFPSMPRPNLRHAQHLVHRFCASRGVSYSQCDLLSSYAQVLRHLHAVGMPLRHPSISRNTS